MTTHFVTSITREPNALKAGQILAKETQTKLKGEKPNFGLLFCSPNYAIEEMLKEIKSIVGEVPIMGCTTSGEFTHEGTYKDGAALALISSDTNHFFVGLGENIKDDPIESIQTALEGFPLSEGGFPHRSAILLLDSLAGKGEEVVLAAALQLGEQVQLAGGAAGDNLEFKHTKVIAGNKLKSDSVAMGYITSQQPVSIAYKHGHIPLSQSMIITKSKDNTVYEIDGLPAFDVWKMVLKDKLKAEGKDINEITDPAEISKLLLRHEFGLQTPGGYKIRHAFTLNPDGSLNFTCTMVEGSVIKIMDSTQEAQIKSAREAVKLALKKSGGRKICGAVIFDCVCRAMILKDQFSWAVEAMKEELGEIPLIGFETYGEVAREEHELSGFHNTTTVVLLIPD